MEDFHFNLLQEAIDKNNQTLEVEGHLLNFVWERGKVELDHIRRIETWKNNIKKAVEECPYFTEEFLKITNSLLEEGRITQEQHQYRYNSIMADEGPYKRILHDTKNSTCRSNAYRLPEIESEFKVNNRRRLKLRSTKMKQKQSIDEMESNLIILEEQLSNRSRLTDSRRSARGHRKIDTLLANVSSLRKNISATKELLTKTENDLNAVTKDKNASYQELFVELKGIYEDRAHLMYEEIERYFQKSKLLGIHENRIMYNKGLKEAEYSLRDYKAIDDCWTKVERAARMKKAGEAVGYDIFMCNSLRDKKKSTKDSPRDKVQKENLGTRDGTKSDTAFTSTTRPTEVAPVSKSAVIKLMGTDDEDGLSPSSSRHTLFKMVCVSSEETFEIDAVKGLGITNVRPQNSEISGVSSSSRLETIEISNDSGARKVLPPEFLPKEFCGEEDSDDLDSDEDGEDENKDDNNDFDASYADSGNGTVLTFDTSLVRLMPRLRSELSNRSLLCNQDSHIGHQRDIRVQAHHDYTARTKAELSFKKGQIIKQKIGENEDGFAYGWTKDSTFSTKRYGWYPVALVSHYY